MKTKTKTVITSYSLSEKEAAALFEVIGYTSTDYLMEHDMSRDQIDFVYDLYDEYVDNQ